MKILGIDMGITSIGWGLIDFNPQEREKTQIIDAGVRIFTKAEHPKDGSSLALPRREARGRRRTLARKRGRMQEIKELFIEYLGLDRESLFEIGDYGSGTIFKEKNKSDVWELRDAALNRKLSPKEMARVLTHIAKRRGYHSNSKSDDSEKDEGKVIEAIKANQENLKKLGYSTPGQMMYRESQKSSSKSGGHFSRIRNTTGDYRHVVTREMLRDEVEKIFSVQEKFSKKYSSELKNRYLDVAFYQRPLKSSEDMVGPCTFESNEKRAPKYSYSAERFVLLGKIINAMMIDENNRYKEKRLLDFCSMDKILKVFHDQKEVKYQTLRKNLEIADYLKFKDVNYSEDPENKKLPKVDSFLKKETWLKNDQKESLTYNDKEGRSHFHKWIRKYADIRRALKLDENFDFIALKSDYKKHPESKEFYSLKGYHIFKKVLSSEEFKQFFQNLSAYNEVAYFLTVEQGIKEIRERLESIPGISSYIDKLVTITGFKGFNHLSIKAMDKLTSHLMSGKRYDEAAREVYGHHSVKKGNQAKLLRILNREENYQLTNPVVKRAFAQFRKVINAIIRKYGQFDSLHIELARELKHSYKQRQEIIRGQNEFKGNKDAAKEKFKELCRREPTANELLKFRLWEEQEGKSIYSSKPISIRELARNDKAFEIDHILPYSRTFDDTLNNKVLVLAVENQHKRNRTPFEWLGKKNEDDPSWLEFKSRLFSFKNLRKAKINKLLNTTLSQKHGEEFDEDDPESNFFINRNLNDTQYMAKFIKNFVEQNLKFADNPDIKQKVKVRNGMVTSHLAYLWGIGRVIQEILPTEKEDRDEKDPTKKVRDNHLHHALDALVIAATTQSEVQRMSTYSARFEDYQFKSKEEKEKVKKLRTSIPFNEEELKQKLSDIFPSYAPRRKVTGAAHEETLYSGKTYRSKNKPELVGASRNYPVKLNRGKTLAKRSSMPRIDLFRHVENKKYFIVPIYVADFVKKQLPNHAIVGGKDKEGNPKSWLEMDDSYEFITSIYKNDLIEVKTKKETVRGYFDGADSSTGTISFKFPQTGHLFRGMGIQGASTVRKFEVSPLGEIHEVSLPQDRVGTLHELRRIKKEKTMDKN